MATNLKGYLKKLGEKGPRKAWKKRYFIQRGNNLHYYVNEKSAQEKGYINLEVAISIERSEKPNHAFRINTPKRIYYLYADSEEQAEYWISGVTKHLKSISNKQDSQLPVQLEQSQSRIADLETQNTKLKNVIDFVARQLNCNSDEIFQSFEFGNPLKIPEQKKPVVVEQKNSNNDHSNHQNNQNQSNNHQVAENNNNKDNSNQIIIVEEEKQRSHSILEEKENKLNEGEKGTKEIEVSSDSEDDDDEDSDIDGDDTNSNTHFGAQVLFEYSARKNYELSISANEVITVLSKHENGWWLGCNSKGVQGYFPGSYVRPIE